MLHHMLRAAAGNQAGAEPFDPAILFAAGEIGMWYDPSDLSTMFVDLAGTVPVTADGDPVGKILDKSGNGHHATAPTSARRPIYKTDGVLHWLESPASSFMTIGNTPLFDQAGSENMQYYAAAALPSDTGRLFGDNCQIYLNSASFYAALRPSGMDPLVPVVGDPYVLRVYNNASNKAVARILNHPSSEQVTLTTGPYYPRYILEFFALGDDYRPFQGKFYQFLVAYHVIGTNRDALDAYMLSKLGQVPV